ncbi:MAG TPA: hypothetical protein VGE69_06495 [Pseudomonadales bacterium]
MSALEELWLWLQGRNSPTDAGANAMHHSRGKQQQAMMPEDRAHEAQKLAETEARVQRNSRYRAGPWQMK